MSALGHARYVMSENPLTLVAFVLFFLLLACALFGPSLVPYDPLGYLNEFRIVETVAFTLTGAVLMVVKEPPTGRYSARHAAKLT